MSSFSGCVNENLMGRGKALSSMLQHYRQRKGDSWHSTSHLTVSVKDMCLLPFAKA